jgi:diphosphoinositol-polyphosphate diphosphatase
LYLILVDDHVSLILFFGDDGPCLTSSMSGIYRCIPFRYVNSDKDGNSESGKVIQVLMISSSSGPGLLFPKGGWENDETVREAAAREAVEEAGVRGILMDFLGNYEFKSKSHQDEFSPEGLCKAAMYALYVKEELATWPEHETRTRKWLTIEEAVESCKTNNKNNTERLQHNKNNNAEAQLTDSFGEDLLLGFAPRSGREQQKLH